MILFCDTSALLKLYIEEAGSVAVKGYMQRAQEVAVCRIAWVEAHAAFARRGREVAEDCTTIEHAKTSLAQDWPSYVVLEVDQSLVERAAEFADTFALRAYDSVQLAAAFELSKAMDTETVFACFDLRLNKAARLLGMECMA